jgi:hypothetical protein
MVIEMLEMIGNMFRLLDDDIRDLIVMIAFIYEVISEMYGIHVFNDSNVMELLHVLKEEGCQVPTKEDILVIRLLIRFFVGLWIKIILLHFLFKEKDDCIASNPPMDDEDINDDDDDE